MPTISTETLPIQRLDPRAKLPTRAHADDAGLDLYGLEAVVLDPGSSAVARTGVALALPKGHVGLVADRSSLGKRGIKTAGGVIDAGYRGEIKVILWNLSSEKVVLEKGDRIAQMLVLPVATPRPQEAENLELGSRGSKGFGSTGS